MKLIRSRKVMGGAALAAALVFGGAVGVAQQQQPEAGQGQAEKHGRRGGHGGHGRGRGEHGGRGFFGGRFAERLNLTDAQKEQLRQIAARHRESTKALREQARQSRQTRGDDGFNGSFDEAAVRAAAQARANASVEMAVAHARMMSEMYNVLTPEQKAQLAADRQQREQRRQERRRQRQERREARGGANAGQTE